MNITSPSTPPLPSADTATMSTPSLRSTLTIHAPTPRRPPIGILVRSPSSADYCSSAKRCVKWSQAEITQVYEIESWDRTPCAVTPKLTYRDLVELKQLELDKVPHSPFQSLANLQMPIGLPRVQIGLQPIFDTPPPTPATPASSPAHTPPRSESPPKPPSSAPPLTSPKNSQTMNRSVFRHIPPPPVPMTASLASRNSSSSSSTPKASSNLAPSSRTFPPSRFAPQRKLNLLPIVPILPVSDTPAPSPMGSPDESAKPPKRPLRSFNFVPILPPEETTGASNAPLDIPREDPKKVDEATRNQAIPVSSLVDANTCQVSPTRESCPSSATPIPIPTPTNGTRMTYESSLVPSSPCTPKDAHGPTPSIPESSPSSDSCQLLPPFTLALKSDPPPSATSPFMPPRHPSKEPEPEPDDDSATTSGSSVDGMSFSSTTTSPDDTSESEVDDPVVGLTPMKRLSISSSRSSTPSPMTRTGVCAPITESLESRVGVKVGAGLMGLASSPVL